MPRVAEVTVFCIKHVKFNFVLLLQYKLFYNQHFYKQRQAQIDKKKRKKKAKAKQHRDVELLTKMSK